MRTLEKRSLDSLVAQVVGDGRVLAPGASISPLDYKYEGTLKQLLKDAFPNTPEVVFAVRDDLIVVSRVNDTPSEVVRFSGSQLRLSKYHSHKVNELQHYAQLLNVTVHPTQLLESDILDLSLVLDESFFVPRSIKGWARLSLYFARLCAAMEELASQAAIKDIVGTGLVPITLLDRRGDEMRLA
jgi:hypothetical protein